MEHIDKEGAAYKDARLEVGNEILSVNGRNLIDVPPDQAIEIFRHCGEVVGLEVCRRDLQHELVKSFETLQVEAGKVQAKEILESGDEMRCCVCLDRRPEVVLVPCGHMNLCH